MFSDIEKLIEGRKALEEYWRICRIKGTKSVIDINNLNNKLNEYNINDLNEFFNFNFNMNLNEVDRCIRFRRVDDLSKPALCDSCEGRSVVTCYAPPTPEEVKAGLCDIGGIAFTDSFDKHYPNSLMAKEQQDECQRLGVNTPFILRPINYYLISEHNFEIKSYCIGKPYKIIEFDFDVMWGMEKYKIWELGNYFMQRFKDRNN